MSHGGQLSHLWPLPLPPNSIGRQERRQLSTWIGTPIHHTTRGIDLHADNVPLKPIRLESNRMSLRLQLPLHIIGNPAFDPQQARVSGMWIDRTRKMPAAELRGFDGFLQRHAEVHYIEKKLQRPLVLLVKSHGAESHKGLTVVQHERRRESGAGSFAWGERIGMVGIQVKNLDAGGQRET